MNLNEIDVVILCGGLGTRLRESIGQSQKVMAQIEGKPFLDNILEYLESFGVARVILCTGFQSTEVEKYYRDKDCDLVIDFSIEDEPLGTGGAFKQAQELIDSEYFIGLNGDSLCPANLKEFFDFHVKKEALASIVVTKVADKKDYGTIAINEDGMISSFDEKSKQEGGGFVNGGIYCFRKEVFDMMPSEEKFSMEKDVFPTLVGNKFYGYITDQELLDIGTPERLEIAKKTFKKG